MSRFAIWLFGKQNLYNFTPSFQFGFFGSKSGNSEPNVEKFGFFVNLAFWVSAHGKSKSGSQVSKDVTE